MNKATQRGFVSTALFVKKAVSGLSGAASRPAKEHERAAAFAFGSDRHFVEVSISSVGSYNSV